MEICVKQSSEKLVDCKEKRKKEPENPEDDDWYEWERKREEIKGNNAIRTPFLCVETGAKKKRQPKKKKKRKEEITTLSSTRFQRSLVA